MPKLTTIAECIYRLQQQKIRVRVSMFNVNSSDFQAITPNGCKKCTDKILRGLNAYNENGNVNFKDLLCQFCTKQAIKNDPSLFRGMSYLERIKIWLDSNL